MKKESACSLLIAELCFSYHCHLGTDEVSRTAPHVLLLVFAVTWCEPSAPKCTNNNPRGAHSREEGLQLADLCRDRPAIALQLGCKYNTGKARIWMLQKKKRTVLLSNEGETQCCCGDSAHSLSERVSRDASRPGVACDCCDTKPSWKTDGLAVCDLCRMGYQCCFIRETVTETHPTTGKSCMVSSPQQVLLNYN